jgi:hypothetical protein
MLVAGCGGGDETTTAGGPHIEAKALEACLNKARVQTGPQQSDSVIAEYAQSAISDGAQSFVIVQPLAQAIVFPENVDLDEAKSQLTAAEQRGGARANGLQADTFGNVLVVYFVPAGADKAAKAPVQKCLGGTPEPLAGFEFPYLAPPTTPQPLL